MTARKPQVFARMLIARSRYPLVWLPTGSSTRRSATAAATPANRKASGAAADLCGIKARRGRRKAREELGSRLFPDVFGARFALRGVRGAIVMWPALVSKFTRNCHLAVVSLDADLTSSCTTVACIATAPFSPAFEEERSSLEMRFG